MTKCEDQPKSNAVPVDAEEISFFLLTIFRSQFSANPFLETSNISVPVTHMRNGHKGTFE